MKPLVFVAPALWVTFAEIVLKVHFHVQWDIGA